MDKGRQERLYLIMRETRVDRAASRSTALIDKDWRSANYHKTGPLTLDTVISVHGELWIQRYPKFNRVPESFTEILRLVDQFDAALCFVRVADRQSEEGQVSPDSNLHDV